LGTGLFGAVSFLYKRDNQTRTVSLPNRRTSVTRARAAEGLGLVPVPIPRSDMTIDEVLVQFLADQRERLSERTYRRYEEVIELLRDCLNSYAYQSLDELEHRRWQKEFDSNEDGAFCRLFGPDKIAENLAEFLDYFMVRKVIAGQELLKASGTVTAKLMTWLAQRGYIDETSAEEAGDQARKATRDLPMADRLGMLLHELTDQAPAVDPDDVADKDWVEDYLEIVDAEPGKIWFSNNVGPISVPRKASDLARPGWSVFVTAAKINNRWQLLEVGVVYP